MISLSYFRNFRTLWGSAATANTVGTQVTSPRTPLVRDTVSINEDAALQISALWACIELRASIIASLPLFVYTDVNGARELARNDRLYGLLHDSPNARMTPFEFMRAVMLSLDLRGGAYVRLVRDKDTKEVFSMWPMAYDQVRKDVLDDGKIIYQYIIGNTVQVLSDESVLHIKGLGNGTTGLDKLAFMNATTNEQKNAQQLASTLFKAGGRVSGVLMVDQLLTQQQREQIQRKFDMIACNQDVNSLHVLEAGMKYQPLGLSPQDQELLESRQYGVEEICSFMGTPAVLINRGGQTTWGSGIAEIKEGFYSLVLAPICVNIQQCIYKNVMTANQRARLTVEFSTDALLRANIKDRMEIYAKATQNGVYTRNFARQLENLPPIAGGDDLTIQSNLLPIQLLGKVINSGGNGDVIKQ
jgi:HK97 family phage portal protein